MDKDKVLKLADLSRIRISDDEAENLSREFEAILGYVKDVGSVSSPLNERSPADYSLKNVMRADETSHESGEYSESLLSAAPYREGGYVKVKKIL